MIVEVIPEPMDRSLALGQRLIGLIYLAIGIYVLFRRWTAPRATHFYLFCLVSFALYALKYTGTFGTLDWTVFWCNVLAESLQPALFLHFALSFPEERLKKSRPPLAFAADLCARRRAARPVALCRSTTGRPRRCSSTAWIRSAPAYDAVFYVLAAALFLRSYSRANTPLLRQQLKWLTRGALLAVVPFTLFYAIPFLLDLRMPSLFTNLASLSIVFLPLTFSWAIVRYRLMDTDLIFKRGVAYTLATGLILGAYFGIIAAAAGLAHNQLARIGPGLGRRHRHRAGGSPSLNRSSAGFRAGSTGSLTAIATTTARRWSSSAAASVRRPISRPCWNPSSSGCRAPCWWRAWRFSWPIIRGP